MYSEVHNWEVYKLTEEHKFVFTLQGSKYYSVKVSLQAKSTLVTCILDLLISAHSEDNQQLMESVFCVLQESSDKLLNSDFLSHH